MRQIVDQANTCRYFKPHRLPGLGTFQDGGVCANCPLWVALCESELLWPSAGWPNLIVSIGTGFEVSASKDDDMDEMYKLIRSSRHNPLMRDSVKTY